MHRVLVLALAEDRVLSLGRRSLVAGDLEGAGVGDNVTRHATQTANSDCECTTNLARALPASSTCHPCV